MAENTPKKTYERHDFMWPKVEDMNKKREQFSVQLRKKKKAEILSKKRAQVKLELAYDSNMAYQEFKLQYPVLYENAGKMSVIGFVNEIVEVLKQKASDAHGVRVVLIVLFTYLNQHVEYQGSPLFTPEEIAQTPLIPFLVAIFHQTNPIIEAKQDQNNFGVDIINSIFHIMCSITSQSEFDYQYDKFVMDDSLNFSGLVDIGLVSQYLNTEIKTNLLYMFSNLISGSDRLRDFLLTRTSFLAWSLQILQGQVPESIILGVSHVAYNSSIYPTLSGDLQSKLSEIAVYLYGLQNEEQQEMLAHFIKRMLFQNKFNDEQDGKQAIEEKKQRQGDHQPGEILLYHRHHDCLKKAFFHIKKEVIQQKYLNSINEIISEIDFDTGLWVNEQEISNFFVSVRKASLSSVNILPIYFGASNLIIGDPNEYVAAEHFVANEDFVDMCIKDAEQHPQEGVRYEAGLCLMVILEKTTARSLIEKVLSNYAEQVKDCIIKGLTTVSHNDYVLAILKAIERLVQCDYEQGLQQMKYFYGDTTISNMILKHAGNQNKELATTALRIADIVDMLEGKLPAQEVDMQANQPQGGFDI